MGQLVNTDNVRKIAEQKDTRLRSAMRSFGGFVGMDHPTVRQVRKTIRNKGHFPSDEAATKLIYLSLRNVEAKWKRPPKEWQAAKSQLAIQFGERFTLTA